MAQQGRVQNLKPIQPGAVRNPEGRNQYSYRRDFEATVDALLRSVYKFETENLKPGEGEMARCVVCNLMGCDTRAGLNLYAHLHCLSELDGKTRGEVIGLVAVQRALSGDEKMLTELLKRMWPASKQVEHQFPGDGRVQFGWKEATGFADLARRTGEHGSANDNRPQSNENADHGSRTD